MRKHVGVEQMRLVDQDDPMDLVASQLVHVRFDGQKEVGGRRAWMQVERVAEVAVKVPSAERRVAAVGQSEAGLRQRAPQRTQDAGLSDAGFAEQDHALVTAKRLLDVGNERRLAL